jgi:hypothetical protein
MSAHRLATFIAGLFFAGVALLALYRLLVWFPITIGSQQVGQVFTFFALVICSALALIFLRGGFRANS